MAHKHLLHHVEIHPHYDGDGALTGHQVKAHHVDGGKVTTHLHPDIKSATAHAHQLLTGHEEAYHAEEQGQSHGKNEEAPDDGAGIPGVPLKMAKGMMSKAGYSY